MREYQGAQGQPMLYTYSDDEPETIEVDNPRDFDGKTRINHEELADFFMRLGVCRQQANRKAELEFEARAPNYGVWGENVPGPSDWDIAGRFHATEASRARKTAWANATRLCNTEKTRSRAYTDSAKSEYGSKYYPNEEQPRRQSRSKTYSSSTKRQTSEEPEYGRKYYPDEEKSRSKSHHKCRSSSPRREDREYRSRQHSDDEDFPRSGKPSSKSYSSTKPQRSERSKYNDTYYSDQDEGYRIKSSSKSYSSSKPSRSDDRTYTKSAYSPGHDEGYASKLASNSPPSPGLYEELAKYGVRYHPDEHEYRGKTTYTEHSSSPHRRIDSYDEGNPRIRHVHREPSSSEPRRKKSRSIRDYRETSDHYHSHHSPDDRLAFSYKDSADIKAKIRDEEYHSRREQTLPRRKESSRHDDPLRRRTSHRRPFVGVRYEPSTSREPRFETKGSKTWAPSSLEHETTYCREEDGSYTCVHETCSYQYV
jgi:hypothetical protein